MVNTVRSAKADRGQLFVFIYHGLRPRLFKVGSAMADQSTAVDSSAVVDPIQKLEETLIGEHYE